MQHTLYSATFLLGGGRAAERSVEGESLQRIITKNMFVDWVMTYLVFQMSFSFWCWGDMGEDITAVFGDE